MIRSYAHSYAHLASILRIPGVELVAPERASRDPLLRYAVSAGDGIAPLITHVFPSVDGYWSMARDHGQVAQVLPAGGEYVVIISTRAVQRLNDLREQLGNAQWIENDLFARLFPATPIPRLDLSELYALLPVFGIAALMGHEVGHAVDGFDVRVPGDAADTVWLAEEISADGHAMRVGLSLASAWAMDQEAQGRASKGDALRVACTLMLLSNAVFDSIDVTASWNRAQGVTHPHGTQRLAGTSVALMELLEDFAENGELAVDAMLAAYSALVTAGRCQPRPDQDLVEQLGERLEEHKDLIETQYAALKTILSRRSKLVASAGLGRPATVT